MFSRYLVLFITIFAVTTTEIASFLTSMTPHEEIISTDVSSLEIAVLNSKPLNTPLNKTCDYSLCSHFHSNHICQIAIFLNQEYIVQSDDNTYLLSVYFKPKEPFLIRPLKPPISKGDIDEKSLHSI